MGGFGWQELLIVMFCVFVPLAAGVGVALVVFRARKQKDTSPDLKKCPCCAELIKAEAKVCRYCGRDLPDSE